MRNKKKIILFILISAILIVGLVILIAPKEKGNSLVNIKSIPKHCENYVLVNTPMFVDRFSSYFVKNPSDISKFYKFLKRINIGSDNLNDLLLNEPIAIYYDENIKCFNAILSVQNSTSTFKKISGEFLEIDFKKNSANPNYSTYVYNNKIHNQLYITIDRNENSHDEIYSKINKSVREVDTSNHNLEAVKLFKENKKNISFNFKNIDTLNKLGVENINGSIDFYSDHMEIIANGIKNNKFPFNDYQELKSTDYGWAEFSVNFNKKIFKPQIFKNFILDSNWDGRLIMSVHQLKNTNKIIGLKGFNEIINYLDLNILIGNLKLDSLRKLNSIPNYKISFKNNFKGFSITNFEKKYNITTEQKKLFSLSIDFDKMIKQKHNEWTWNAFKSVFKRMNFKTFELEGENKKQNGFQIVGKLTTLDTTKNLLLSPFIY